MARSFLEGCAVGWDVGMEDMFSCFWNVECGAHAGGYRISCCLDAFGGGSLLLGGDCGGGGFDLGFGVWSLRLVVEGGFKGGREV